MSRIFANIKEESLRMAIDRVASSVQSEIAVKNFYNAEKETLKSVLDNISLTSEKHINQDIESKGEFTEKISKSNNNSSILTR